MFTLKTLVLFSFSLLTVYSLNAQQYQDFTMQHEGQTRSYTLYVPAGYDGTANIPLLFNFHGGDGNIQEQIYTSDMSTLADNEGFIVAYPQALADPNDGGSANWLHKDPTDVDDIYFIEALIQRIDEDYAIDLNRVYACGYSLGGEFTYELACRLNDQIAAVAAVARTMGGAQTELCNPSHPTGILTILGTDDFISPYGGLVFGGIEYYISADAVHNYWAVHNNTNTTPEVEQLPNTNTSDGSTVERYVWGDGDACVRVEHLKVNGGGHDWPGTFGNMDINSNEEIWNFVSQFDLNGLIDCNVSSLGKDLDPSFLSIFPNPALDIIEINGVSDEFRSFSVYSVSGELLHSGELAKGDNRINIEFLTEGVYFIDLADHLFRFVKL